MKLDQSVVTPVSQSDSEIQLQMPRHDNGYGVLSMRNASGVGYAEYLFVPPRLDEIPPGFITTVAGVGTYVRDFGPAKDADLGPAGLAIDPAGNIYVAVPQNNQIVRILRDGTIERLTAPSAGGALVLGDGGPSTEANVNFPRAVAVTVAGDIYVPDDAQHRIRKIDGATGVISTIAGDGSTGYAGDGGPALQAHLAFPTHIAADTQDVFFIDFGASRIRRIHLSDGIITTFAGNGTSGNSGDGGPATAAQFNVGDGDKGHLALDGAGNLYLGDSANYRIRRIDRRTGTITTFYAWGNDGSANDAVGEVRSLAFDLQGNLYYGGSGRIVEVSASGKFVTSWGNGMYALPVEGAPATTTGLGLVEGIAIDTNGDIIYSNAAILRVQRIDVAAGKVFTVAGIGPHAIGEYGPAVAAVLSQSSDVAVDAAGSLLVAETQRLRKIDRAGVISTIAGNGSSVGLRPPAPALLAVTGGVGIEVDPRSREIDVAEFSVIQHIDRDGILREIAGRSGECGYTGDGGPALNARFCQAWDTARDHSGNLLIADTNNNRIRRIDAQTGIISTIAGNGGPVNGYERYGEGHVCGDGGPAIDACLNTPFGIAVDAADNLYVSGPSGIRRIDARTGIIDIFSPIQNVSKLVFDSAGYLYGSVIAGVFRLDASGARTWIAGRGGSVTDGGFSGDGGPATDARVLIRSDAAGIAIDGEGNVFFCDNHNQRVRATRYGAVLAPPNARIQVTVQKSAIQTTANGSAIRATIFDEAGRRVPGVRVDFRAPLTGASCTLSSAFAITNGDGGASVSCTSNCVGGTYSVTARPLNGSSTASVSFTNAAGPCRRRR